MWYKSCHVQENQGGINVEELKKKEEFGSRELRLNVIYHQLL